MTIKITYLSAALLLLFMLNSCIGDDLSDCPQEGGLLLGFQISPQDGNDARLSDISTLDVFVFDEDGHYLEHHRDNQPQLQDRDYRIALSLPDGKYYFVAWGNTPGSDYQYTPSSFITQTTDLFTARLNLIRPATNTITHQIEHLYHGHINQYQVIEALQQEVFMPIVQNTYTIRVEIANFGMPASPPQVVISDHHDGYDFQNNRMSSSELHYAQTCRIENGEQKAELRTLQLWENSTTRLKVYEWDGTLHYDASLIDLIHTAATNSGIAMDLDRIHTYTIRLVYDRTLGEFSVTIDGWNAEEESQTIHPQG